MTSFEYQTLIIQTFKDQYAADGEQPVVLLDGKGRVSAIGFRNQPATALIEQPPHGDVPPVSHVLPQPMTDKGVQELSKICVHMNSEQAWTEGCHLGDMVGVVMAASSKIRAAGMAAEA